MMAKYLLTFDTSSSNIVLNLASFSYDKQQLLSVVAKTHHAPRAANTQLLTHIDAALNQAGVSRRELAAVAVGVTLGSYTGVRIGVATAKGITQALGIPLYALAVSEEKLSPDHLLECFEQAYAYQTGDPGTVLPQYTQMSYAEEAEKKEHPARYAIGACAELPMGGDSPLLTLRLLTPYDLGEFSALASELSCFSWSEQQYADELHSSKNLWLGAFVADADRRQCLVGYIGANAAVAEADLLQIAVCPKYRKQGIATAMFELLLEQLRERKVESLTLEVRENNNKACKLYESLGFKQVATRENYYNNPTENAQVFKLALCSQSIDDEGSSAHSAEQKRDYRLPFAGRGRGEYLHHQCFGGETALTSQLLLGIETSCDETAVAVMEGTRLLSNVVASQVKFHARFGGVVPEIASRKHSEAIVAAVDRALIDAGISASAKLSFSSLTGIAVTDKPGLIGALVVGQAYAKGLAWALDIPLYGINHLEGHLYACALDDSALHSDSTDALADLPSPHVALIVSGGHTALVYSPRPHVYETLGETLDDAAGEAFDKVAKVLGLGYPGGPILSKLADSGNPHAIDFPRAMMHSKDYAFSLSGLKTAVITYIRQAEESDQSLNIPDIAASFQQAIVEVQVAKAVRAATEKNVKHFIMAGGVAANRALREALIDALAAQGIKTHIPPLKYCGDNAAMIVRTAIARLQANVDASTSTEQANTTGHMKDNYLQALPLDADCSSSAALNTANS
jgi:N6-L-threonylcarbamoyladenine synthase